MRVSGSPGVDHPGNPYASPGATAGANVAAPMKQWHSRQGAVNVRTRHWQELQRCGKAYRHVLPTDALRPRDFGKGSAQGGVGAVAVDGVEELGLKLGTRIAKRSAVVEP